MYRRIRNTLMLDKRNGWIGGVCAGIARTTRTDPAAIRVALVIAGLFLPKLVIAAYLLAWLLLEPHESDRI